MQTILVANTLASIYELPTHKQIAFVGKTYWKLLAATFAILMLIAGCSGGVAAVAYETTTNRR